MGNLNHDKEFQKKFFLNKYVPSISQASVSSVTKQRKVIQFYQSLRIL